MRLYQQIRPSIARSAKSAAGALLFASGMSVSAFGQVLPSQGPVLVAQGPPVGATTTPVPPLRQAAVPQGTPLAIEDAVRMALENNLGIQIEKLNPQIQVYGVSRARGVWAPALVTGFSRRASTSPPTDFNTSGAGDSISTNASFSSSGGLQQQTKWGGNYSLVFDGARATSNAINSVFNPRLDSGLNANINQPLLRNFKIDGLRLALFQAKNQLQAADLQLQQRITQTGRNVRAAYYQLVGAIAGLEVAEGSLDLSRQQLKNNETRVEVGTMAPIDIVAAKAEVASNEENVIIQQSNIESAQDQLRGLVMNPSQPGFWEARFAPSEQPVLAPKAIDVDAAIKNALANRTDILEFKKGMELTDANLKYAANQKLPAVDLNARYGITGVAGTQLLEDRVSVATRSFSDALRDVFANDFKTWSFSVNVSYPIGTSTADAAYAQARLQKQQDQTSLANLELAVTQSVRDAGRRVSTNLKRVEATRKAREFAEERLAADEKRFTVGLATTFELVQAQRDLARARQSELNATIDYNQSLVDFEAVQIAPLR
jgi:outer membrane protein TolC